MKVGDLFLLHHPLGHKIFFKKGILVSGSSLINNSKVDTSFTKIVPYKRTRASDFLFLLGQNGVILQMDLSNVAHPQTLTFEGEDGFFLLDFYAFFVMYICF